MKLLNLSSLLTVSTILILSGCGAKPKPKKEAVIDASLPKVSLTRTATKSDMTSIALEWKRIKDKRVEGIYIYRESLDENKSIDPAKYDPYLDTIDNRFSTHFLDTDVHPGHRYNYYFISYSDDAQGERSEIYQTATKPVLSSVTWIYAANGMPRSAKILWRPHTNKLVNAYEIYRKTFNEQEWKLVTKIDGRLSAEYIDLGLKDSYTYQYHVRALTYNGIRSTPSQSVKSITKDLPLVVTNVQASDNIPKKIKISWDASDEKDFSHYNLYRSKDADGSYVLLAKLKRSNFENAVQEDGAKYFYMVTSVDKDALESPYQTHSTQGMSMSKPLPPAVVDAKLIGNEIVIKWRKNDQRAKSFIVRKRYNEGLFNTIIDEFNDIKEKSFIDTQITPNTKYFYQVLSVDKNGITSEPTIEAVIQTKEKE